MMSTVDLARREGVCKNTIIYWCQQLNCPQVGKRYILTPAMADKIAARLRHRPGRPPNDT